MRRPTVLALVGILFLVVACSPFGVIRGTGPTVSRDFPVEGFSAVQAANGFDVTITQGEAYSVTVIAPESLFRYLDVARSGNTLRLRLAPGRSYLVGPSNLRAQVTMPTLDGVRLSGASQITAAGFGFTPDFEAELSGASRLEGEFEASDVRLTLSGGSRLNLAGQTDRLVIDGSGGSEINLTRFLASVASVELSGGSTATINVTEELEYDLSGGSRLRYAGGPSITDAEASGGSQAIPEG
ncbi:MAG: head GIN domain-containing protein [Anaerolineae bacterium]